MYTPTLTARAKAAVAPASRDSSESHHCVSLLPSLLLNLHDLSGRHGCHRRQIRVTTAVSTLEALPAVFPEKPLMSLPPAQFPQRASPAGLTGILWSSSHFCRIALILKEERERERLTSRLWTHKPFKRTCRWAHPSFCFIFKNFI